MLEQLLGAAGMVEDFDQVGNPRHLQIVARATFLIGPVGGKPALGLGVHVAIADLDFDARLGIVDDGGVERTVAVALGGRDIILVASRDHRPALMDQPQCLVAFVRIADDDAERHHIGQLFEADVPLGHLLPDRIGVLFAPGHLGFESVVGEVELEPEADPVDQVAAGIVELLQAAG